METRTAADAWIGRVVAEKFRVTRCLGVGGHGAVFEAENTWTGRRVALKVLLGAAALNAEMSERFLREARAATRVGHPNIVDVLDMGRDPADGSLFIVEELLQGEDLRELLRRERTLDPHQAIELLAPVMEALSAAHTQGVLHRDLKPANVYLARGHDGRTVPKLIDFGVSHVDDPEANQLTQMGALLGTPDYMSPEQARGEPATAASDVWAMGVILYECLSGTRPYRAANYNALLVRILADDAPPLRSVVPGVSPALEAVVHGALARDPAQRTRSMAALREALTRWASTHPRRASAGDVTPSVQMFPSLDAGDVTPVSLAPPEMDPSPEPPPSARPATMPAQAFVPPAVAPPAAPFPAPVSAPVSAPVATPRAWSSAAPPPPTRRGYALLWLVALPLVALVAWRAARALTAPSPDAPAPAASSRAEPPDAVAPAPAVVTRDAPPPPDAATVDDATVDVLDATTLDATTSLDADRVVARDRPAPALDRPRPTADRPELPAPQEMQRVLRAATPAVRGCLNSATATVLVAVTFRGDGRIDRVQVPAPWASTPAGACIAAVLGQLRVAPFTQSRFTMTWPYVIRPAAPAGSR